MFWTQVQLLLLNPSPLKWFFLLLKTTCFYEGLDAERCILYLCRASAQHNASLIWGRAGQTGNSFGGAINSCEQKTGSWMNGYWCWEWTRRLYRNIFTVSSQCVQSKFCSQLLSVIQIRRKYRWATAHLDKTASGKGGVLLVVKSKLHEWFKSIKCWIFTTINLGLCFHESSGFGAGWLAQLAVKKLAVEKYRIPLKGLSYSEHFSAVYTKWWVCGILC